jgi:RNA polymerase sigma factor (sigma-70 family)
VPAANLATAHVLDLQRPSSDTELVAACLRSDEAAWACLVDKYKRLIFSIPLRQGLDREDAADIFQAVCVDLVAELPRLRDPQALPKWLIQTTAHKCTRHQRRQQRWSPDTVPDVAAPTDEIPETALCDVEQEQALRDAVISLPPRCRLIVDMLFFETPARPYREVAAQLGLATGSIGFMRSRCLERLRDALRRAGV